MGGEKFTPCKRNRSQSSWEINVGDEETEVDALWFTWATREAEAGEGLRLGWPDVQNSAQKMWNLRQHLWLEWTGLSGSGLGRWRVGGVSIGRGWLWALGDLVSPCTVSVAQEQFQASPGLSLIFTGSFSKGL